MHVVHLVEHRHQVGIAGREHDDVDLWIERLAHARQRAQDVDALLLPRTTPDILAVDVGCRAPVRSPFVLVLRIAQLYAMTLANRGTSRVPLGP